jgi:hypothetical protein
MGNLSDFERGAPLAGASETETVTLLSEPRTTVCKVFTNHGNTPSAKKNGGRNSVQVLTQRDRRTLRRILSKIHTTTAAQVTAELNILLEDPVFTKTVRRELHKSNIHFSDAIAKPLITESSS